MKNVITGKSTTKNTKPTILFFVHVSVSKGSSPAVVIVPDMSVTFMLVCMCEGGVWLLLVVLSVSVRMIVVTRKDVQQPSTVTIIEGCYERCTCVGVNEMSAK